MFLASCSSIPAMTLSVDSLDKIRKPVAIAFGLCLVIFLSGIFPYFSNLYEAMPVAKHAFEFLAFVLGLVVAIGEFRHSGEANEHRAEMVELVKKANAYRDSADADSDEVG